MRGFIPYLSRSEAGRELAGVLSEYKGQDAVVVALPRGGLPLGFEVARALECPLDLLLVRKIGAPGQPELAMGAIVGVKPPVAIINEEVRRFFGVNSDYIKTQEDEALVEIERRRSLWGASEATDHHGKIVIVVDDGIATGTSAEAAVAAIRQEKPEMIVLAVPVAPRESVDRLRPLVERLVCLHTPDTFLGVGAFYRDFHQLSDAEVAAYLRESKPGRR